MLLVTPWQYIKEEYKVSNAVLVVILKRSDIKIYAEDVNDKLPPVFMIRFVDPVLKLLRVPDVWFWVIVPVVWVILPLKVLLELLKFVAIEKVPLKILFDVIVFNWVCTFPVKLLQYKRSEYNI